MGAGYFGAIEMKKRIIDLAIALPGFFAASPVLWMIALAMRITEGNPVFFKQVRPGKDGIPFTITSFEP